MVSLRWACSVLWCVIGGKSSIGTCKLFQRAHALPQMPCPACAHRFSSPRFDRLANMPAVRFVGLEARRRRAAGEAGVAVAGDELVGAGAPACLPALQTVRIMVPLAPDGGQSAVLGLLHQELEQLVGEAAQDVEMRWIHNLVGVQEEFVAEM